MKLITEEQSEILQANYWKHHAKPESEVSDDSLVPVKLFNPTGAGTWFVIEQDPDQPDLLFGLFHIHVWEWGYVSLAELQSFEGLFGLGIERDLYYTSRTVKELKEKLESGELHLL